MEPSDPTILKPTKRADGWWLDARRISPDVPEWGPYGSKREAEEARRSYLRSQKYRKTPLLAAETESPANKPAGAG